MAAMKFRFRIVNSGIAEREVQIEHEGEPAIVRQKKLHVDAEPLDGTGQTLELTLPADLADKFPEGATITAALTVEAPAEEETA